MNIQSQPQVTQPQFGMGKNFKRFLVAAGLGAATLGLGSATSTAIGDLNECRSGGEHASTSSHSEPTIPYWPPLTTGGSDHGETESHGEEPECRPETTARNFLAGSTLAGLIGLAITAAAASKDDKATDAAPAKADVAGAGPKPEAEKEKPAGDEPKA